MIRALLIVITLIVLTGCEDQTTTISDAFLSQRRVKAVSSLKVPEVYDGCNDCSLIARQIAWSIDNEPQLWKNKGYNIDREGGSSIWVASGERSLGIGPTWAKTANPPKNDQSLIWRAYVRWTQTEWVLK